MKPIIFDPLGDKREILQDLLRQNLENRLSEIDILTLPYRYKPALLQYPHHQEELIDSVIEKVYKTAAYPVGLSSKEETVFYSFIRSCMEIGVDVHKWEKRDNELPYITHPFGVGYILLEMGLGRVPIGAGVLHDALENYSFKIEDILSELEKLVPHQHEIKVLIESVSKNPEIEPKYQKIDLYESINRKDNKTRYKAMAIKVADVLYNLLTIDDLLDKPHKTAESRKRSLLIMAKKYALPFAKEVDRKYKDYGSGILIAPYMESILQEHRV